jgi:hypothetical protein
MSYWTAGSGLPIAGRQLMAGGTQACAERIAMSLPSGERLGSKEIRKPIAKKDREALRVLLLQYLVLNPHAFEQEGMLTHAHYGSRF